MAVFDMPRIIRLVADQAPLLTPNAVGVRLADRSGSADGSGADGSGTSGAGEPDGSQGVRLPTGGDRGSSGSASGGASGETHGPRQSTSDSAAGEQSTSDSFLDRVAAKVAAILSGGKSSSSAPSGADAQPASGHSDADKAGNAASGSAETLPDSADGLRPEQSKDSAPATTGGKSDKSSFAGRSSRSSATTQSGSASGGSSSTSGADAGQMAEKLVTSILSGVAKLLKSIF